MREDKKKQSDKKIMMQPNLSKQKSPQPKKLSLEDSDAENPG